MSITRSKIVQMSSTFAYMTSFDRYYETHYVWPFGNDPKCYFKHFCPHQEWTNGCTFWGSWYISSIKTSHIGKTRAHLDCFGPSYNLYNIVNI